MLIMMTWMLFWKLYGLAVGCLIAILIGCHLCRNVERHPGVRDSSEGRLEQASGESPSGSHMKVEVDDIVIRHLKIWEPEAPPIIKAAVNTRGRSTHNNGKGKATVHTPGVTKDQSVQVKSNVREKPGQQNKVFRNRLRQIAAELAACLNEVAENTATERELDKAMRLVIRQHPVLQRLSYEDALQTLLWTENELEPLARVLMTQNEE
jgi:hypothetical protein